MFCARHDSAYGFQSHAKISSRKFQAKHAPMTYAMRERITRERSSSRCSHIVIFPASCPTSFIADQFLTSAPVEARAPSEATGGAESLVAEGAGSIAADGSSAAGEGTYGTMSSERAP